jgi:uncharacterized protein (DUF305 family)
MKMKTVMRVAAFVGCSVLGACATSSQAPAQQTPPPTPPATTQPAADSKVRNGYSLADVRFMQGMIGHHAQALTMSALIPQRTQRQDFRLMGERITLSQVSEIEQMTRWLQARGEEVPAKDAHVHAAMGHGELMPGMLTEAELKQLEEARGVEFEKLFLQLMIKHHEGALHMVKQLFATPASGQEPELFMLSSDVDADQTAEIKRMRALLSQLQ